MLSGDGIENSQKTVGLTGKKNDNNFAPAAHFFVHFFALVLHGDNVKLPENSELHVLWTKCCMWSCSLFSLPLIFTLVAASISHFLTAAIKFSCYSSNEIGLLCFFISGSSSFFVIHANKDIKIKSKERIGFVDVVFYL